MPFGGGLGKRPSGGATVRLARRTSAGSVRRPFRRAGLPGLGGRGTAGAGFAGAHQQPTGPRVAGAQVLGLGKWLKGAWKPREEDELGGERPYNHDLLLGVADLLKKLNVARQQIGQPDLVWREMTPEQRQRILRRVKWDLSGEGSAETEKTEAGKYNQAVSAWNRGQ